MRPSATLIIILTLLTALVVSSNSRTQQGAVAIDHISCIFHADTVMIPGNIRITFRFTNNTDRRVDVANGFRFHSPDGAVWDSVTVAQTDGGVFASYFDITYSLYINPIFFDAADTLGLLGAGTTTSQVKRLPVGYNGTPFTVTLWNVGEAMHGKHFCVDSSFFSPGGTWKWVSLNGGIESTYYPIFDGLPGMTYTPGYGYCFLLYNLPCGNARDRSGIMRIAAESGCPCGSCCEGTTGNVNDAGIVDLGDLSALVSYLTGGGYVLPCDEEANINNSGIVDLSDLSALVSFLTGGGYILPNCQ